MKVEADKYEKNVPEFVIRAQFQVKERISTFSTICSVCRGSVADIDHIPFRLEWINPRYLYRSEIREVRAKEAIRHRSLPVGENIGENSAKRERDRPSRIRRAPFLDPHSYESKYR